MSVLYWAFAVAAIALAVFFVVGFVVMLVAWIRKPWTEDDRW